MAFDADAATQAWLATLNGAARARSDAYFEGGYWLILWGTLVIVVSNLLVLHLGWAAILSRWADRVSGGRKALRAFLFALVYLLLILFITLPWTLYTDFSREHQYGLSNQNISQWSADFVKAQAIGIVLNAVLFMGVHASIRRAPRHWWLWGTGLVVAGLTILIALGPLFIEPLFNKYTPMPAGQLRDQVLAMARANGVPATQVFVVDASRQTSRISANVAGLAGTTRIALNDNLLKQPADEVRAVLGHEIGHYALNHVWKGIVALGLVAAFGFWVTARTIPALLARFADRWQIRLIDDPAMLPVALIVIALLEMALTPVLNTITRTQEMEADRYGLNAARAPDAFASTAMKLSQYRKIDPSPLEEAIFFDHPSGHTRVATAMRWKAEHIGEPDIR